MRRKRWLLISAAVLTVVLLYSGVVVADASVPALTSGTGWQLDTFVSHGQDELQAGTSNASFAYSADLHFSGTSLVSGYVSQCCSYSATYMALPSGSIHFALVDQGGTGGLVQTWDALRFGAKYLSALTEVTRYTLTDGLALRDSTGQLLLRYHTIPPSPPLPPWPTIGGPLSAFTTVYPVRKGSDLCLTSDCIVLLDVRSKNGIVTRVNVVGDPRWLMGQTDWVCQRFVPYPATQSSSGTKTYYQTSDYGEVILQSEDAG
jgi:hypothetical protein